MLKLMHRQQTDESLHGANKHAGVLNEDLVVSSLLMRVVCLNMLAMCFKTYTQSSQVQYGPEEE